MQLVKIGYLLLLLVDRLLHGLLQAFFLQLLLQLCLSLLLENLCLEGLVDLLLQQGTFPLAPNEVDHRLLSLHQLLLGLSDLSLDLLAGFLGLVAGIHEGLV